MGLLILVEGFKRNAWSNYFSIKLLCKLVTFLSRFTLFSSTSFPVLPLQTSTVLYETLTYAISWFKWIKGSGPQNILSNLTGKIKRNTRSDAGRGSKQDVVCVTVSASLGGLCVAPIWWQTVLRMTPWEFPGNYYYLLPLLLLVCKALYCWLVFKWVLLQ